MHPGKSQAENAYMRSIVIKHGNNKSLQEFAGSLYMQSGNGKVAHAGLNFGPRTIVKIKYYPAR